MVTLVNRAKMATDTTGTGVIALAGAVAGYQSFSAAGVSDGDLVRYTIEDGNSWEIGTGTYTASGTTLSRNVEESSSAGSPINLSGNAVVFVTVAGADLQNAVDMDQGVATTDSPTFVDLNITDKIVHVGDTNTAIRFPANDTVTVETGGVERLRVNSAGRVGIGTSNPQEELEVFSAVSNADIAARSSVPTGSSRVAAVQDDYYSGPSFGEVSLRRYNDGATGTQFGVSASNLALLSALNSSNFVIGTNGTAPLIFATLSAERLRITSTGNVGIGTSSPLEPLHVENVNADVLLKSTVANGNSRVYFGDPDNNGAGQIAYAHSGDFLAFVVNATEKVRITSGGNVGIGETAPDYKLDVNGTFGFTPGASVTPVDNGDVVFELTNNTTLTIKAKGSDGVVRSGTVTLA